MDAIERLTEHQAICDLKYRYVRGLDTQDWPLLEQCFTEDVVLWPQGGVNYIARGRDEVMAMIKEIVTETYYSSHVVVHPEISFIDENNAVGLWRMDENSHFTAAHPRIVHIDIEPGLHNTGVAYYRDEYVKIDGEWKISNTGYNRIFEMIYRPGEVGGEFRPGATRGKHETAIPR